jgi:hypothetical protein
MEHIFYLPEKKRNLFFLTHLGLGDLIWCIGAIRFFAEKFKEVRVVCKHQYKEQFEIFFSDLDNVKPVLMNSGDTPWYHYEESRGCIICLSAGYVTYKYIDRSFKDYPDCFYDDMNVPREVRTTHFYIPKPVDSCVPPSVPYIFVVEKWSASTHEIFNTLNTNLLVIDPNKNHYELGHPFHDEAEKFLNQVSIAHYMDVIQNAEEIHGVDSSILCLAAQLDLSRVKRKCCHYARSDCIKNLGIFEIL